MKKSLVIILSLSLLLLVGCKNNAPGNNEGGTDAPLVVQETNNVLQTVNGDPITVESFQKYYAMQSYDFEKEYGESVWNIEQDGRTMKEIRQEQTVEYMIRVKIIERYLTDRGLVVENAVIDEAFDKYMASITGDDEIQAYFEDNGIDEAFLKGFLKDQYFLSMFEQSVYDDVANDDAVQSLLFDGQYIRYKTRHILVDDEAVLNEVVALLNDEENPADFSDMARIYSIHSTSAVTGGDLGYRLVGSMPAAYETVALTIEPYTVSDPVETEYGYHLIFVDDKQMLQDMIDSGMPEEEIETYKTEIIKRYAASETVKVFDRLRQEATLEPEEANMDLIEAE